MNDVSTKFSTIERFPLYRFGNDGSVWSRRVQGSSKKIGPWHRMRTRLNSNGYSIVGFWVNRKFFTFSVHRLILEAFIGPAPVGMEACHGDGDRANNLLSNLRWDTKSANNADKRRHGTMRSGEKCNFARLTAEQVREIKNELVSGKTGAAMADRFGVVRSTISMISNGSNWKDVNP